MMEKNSLSAELRIQCILMLGLLWAKGVNGERLGAPSSACGHMTPQHDQLTPQTTDPPYRLTFDKKAINPGGEVSVTIRGKTGADKFQGFLIVARKPGDETTAIGELKDGGDGDTRKVICDEGLTGEGATHKNYYDSKDKSYFRVIWVAPKEPGKYDMLYEEFIDKIQLNFTVAKVYNTFWAKKQTQEYETIEVTDDPSAIRSEMGSSADSADNSLRIPQLLIGSLSLLTLLMGMSSVDVDLSNSK